MSDTTQKGDHGATMDGLSVVVVPRDLETLEIVRFVQEVGKVVGARVHPLSLSPQGRVLLSQADINDMGGQVILVSIADQAVRARIERTGRGVEGIDHAVLQDRWSPLSRLERVVQCLGLEPGDRGPAGFDGRRRTVAAGARDFIPGLERLDPGGLARFGDLRGQDLTLRRAVRARAPLDPLSFDPVTWAPDLEVTRTLLSEAVTALDAGRAGGWTRVLDCRVGGNDRQRVVVARLPARFHEVAEDAVYAWVSHLRPGGWREEGQSVEMVVLLGAEGESGERPSDSRGMLWSGPASRRAWLPHWFGETARDRAPGLERHAEGGGILRFTAWDTLGQRAQEVEAMANLVLEDILSGARPLQGWRTIFSIPLFLGDALDPDASPSGDPPAGTPKLTEAILAHLAAWRARAGSAPRPEPLTVTDQERLYFLPDLRDRLLPPVSAPEVDQEGGWREAERDIRAGSRLVEIALPCDDLSLSLTMAELAGRDGGTCLRVPLESLRLVFVPGEVVLLEWTVGGQAARRAEWGTTLLDVVDGGGEAEGEGETLAEVMTFNAEVRLVFSAWREENPERREILPVVTLLRGGAEIGTLIRNREVSRCPITGWLAALIAEATGLSGADLGETGSSGVGNAGRLRLLCDERARVVTAVFPQGGEPVSPPGRRALDCLRARILTVDPYGEGPAYDAAQTTAEYRRGLYDRFADMGTVLGATAHSLMMVAWANPFALSTLMAHMTTVYRRLFLVAQAQDAALAGEALRLAEILERADIPTAAGVGGNPDAWITAVRSAHGRFAAQLCEEHLSSQVQGREVFALIRQSMELDAAFHAAERRLDRFEAWGASLRNRRPSQ
ncbi:hypothetical protein [Rhodospirillum sp. A1_3_36]|uniref:hypothetical protein n=1 Tax=Rhodospirillum sp. A1_3_36 TaxID=3391666 RepID=UPI0039A777DB